MTELMLATADPDFEQRVRTRSRAASTASSATGARVLAGRAGVAMIEELGHRGAEVVAIGPGIAPTAALQLARAIDHDRPDISTVIVARAVERPPPVRAPRRRTRRDRARHAARRAPRRVRAGPRRRHARGAARSTPKTTPVDATTAVILSMCPKGGAGKTTMSTNLALGLAQVAPGEVVIVDLDLQFGDVASALGLASRRYVRRRHCARSTRSTRPRSRPTSPPTRRDLYVLCAPLHTDRGRRRRPPSRSSKVLTLLIESFKYVVIDTASGPRRAHAGRARVRDRPLLISATDVPSIRSTQKEIDALRVIGKPEHRWHFVLNRADAKTGLTIAAIETAVGINVDVAIPSSRVGAAVAEPGRCRCRVRSPSAGVAGDVAARAPPRAPRRTGRTRTRTAAPSGERGGDAMKLSERMSKQSRRRGRAGRRSAPSATRVRRRGGARSSRRRPTLTKLEAPRPGSTAHPHGPEPVRLDRRRPRSSTPRSRRRSSGSSSRKRRSRSTTPSATSSSPRSPTRCSATGRSSATSPTRRSPRSW